ncbi:MAG: DotH/IcmK family type IV secretion protein [Candidatus Eutrophobiaceae bacterium]
MERGWHLVFFPLIAALCQPLILIHAKGDAPISPEFSAALERLLPLAPEEIRHLRSLLEEKQKAIQEVVRPDKTSLKSLVVDLQPGAETPIIELLPGHAVSLEIADRTAAPWTIETHVTGDPGRFHVIVPEIGERNVLTVTPQTRHGSSNLILQLLGQSTPVSFVLQANPNIRHFHDRVSVLVDGMGPNAAPELLLAEAAVEDLTVMGVLDGVAPEGSRALQASSPLLGGAWRNGQTLWLRGAFLLLSPAADMRISGAGGMRAYRLPFKPVIIVSDAHGKLHSVRLADHVE